MPEAAAKSPAKKAAKPKAKPAHPPTASMVMAAVKALKEAKGSSLPAIKKYIAGNYKVRIFNGFLGFSSLDTNLCPFFPGGHCQIESLCAQGP